MTPGLDLDLIADLIDESLPWFHAWLVLLALLLSAVVLAEIMARLKRSPLDRLLRRRLG